jgi:signal transduction histidine kinase/ActR/RegA family two-component response regulator
MSRHDKKTILAAFSFLLLGFCLFSSENSRVRIGWFQVPHYQETSADGRHSGYMYEMLQAVSERAGFVYNYVPGTRTDCLAMLDDGRADIMCGVAELPDRSDMHITSIPIITASLQLIARKDDIRFSFDDYNAMNGMTVASIYSAYQKSHFEKLEREHGFKAHFTQYDDSEKVLQALVHGNADLALVSSITDTSRFSIVSQFSVHGLYIAVSPERPELAPAFDNAVQQLITEYPNYENDLFESYFGSYSQGSITFTQSELDFINRSPVINVYVRKKTPVLSYMRGDEFSGFIRDVFDSISENTGLHFRFIPETDNRLAIEKTRADRNSINAYIAGDFGWAEDNQLRLTHAVTDYPLVFLYSKKLDHPIHSASYLDNGFIPENSIRKAMYRMIPFTTPEKALEAVTRGTADAYLTNMYIGQQLLAQKRYHFLMMSPADTFKLNLSFGVPLQSDRELLSVINKALRNISDSEKTNFLRSALSESYHYTLIDFICDNIIILILLLMLFSLMAVIIIMQKRHAVQLANANKNKDAFLANMSHDFRTPLTAIKGFAYLGKTENDTKYYSQIISSGDYMLDLVKDILNIQQYAQGKTLDLSPEPVLSQQLTDEILEVVKPRADAKHITIVKHETINYPYLYVDSMRIKQIFINLLNNAVKYSPEGSTVIWKTDDTVENTKVHIISEISDHGAGMSADFIRNNLFHPFEREHNSFSLSEGGSGLGLSVTKLIIDRMKGQISVKSELGKGSTFSVDIPVETLTAEVFNRDHRKTDISAENADFTGRHILICEDNELNTYIIKSILEKHGCAADTAENGSIGLEKFRSSSLNYYDAVLMDVRMPVMDGLEATRAIRTLDRTDAVQVPIIALSANAFEIDTQNAIQAGMTAYLSKPIEVEKLFTTLSEVLR